MPTDLVSFIWGMVVAAIVIFLTGFLQEAGKDAYGWIRNKVNPPSAEEPDPIAVSRDFEATAYHPGDCAWIKEEDTYQKEREGYFFYREELKNAICYRTSGSKREFLMVKPEHLRDHA